MLTDKVILITGASRGIGKAIALITAKNHAHVIINYNKNETYAVEFSTHLNKQGFSTSIINADISCEDQVKEMFAFIKQKYGKIDVLINNAGIMRNALLAFSSMELFNHTIDVNLKGVFLCTRSASNLMRKQKSGKIINISSIVGLYGNQGQTIYSASKAAVIGFTKSSAKELGRYGITVNAIAPGVIETDLLENLKSEDRNKMIPNIALGRTGTAEDVAKVVLFLSSDLSDYVSGAVISVDGCQIM